MAEIIRGPMPAMGQAAVVSGGGGGPYDPDMEARVARLERDSELTRTALERIEKAVADNTVELRDLRRDLKEKALPAIREQLADVQGQLKKTPTLNQLIAIMVVIFSAAALFTGANQYLARQAPSAVSSAPR